MVQNKVKLAVCFHPGRTLSEKLEEMGMGVKEFAVRTSKPEKTVIAVIKGDSSITPDMAVAFETVTMIPAHFWMNAQRMYDEYQARLRRADLIAMSEEWMRKFPVNELVKRGWIPACANSEEKVNALFAFFGISTEKAWEDYYLNQELKIAFRISLANTKDPYAISAWLRYGELQASKILVKREYSSKLLREYLPLMKSEMANAREDWYRELQQLCADVGVKLINVPSLPKAPVSGATRWINDVPVIQLSNRYNRYDIFWFTFFHEVGHILLHGKKDVFLEGIYCSDFDMKKEEEADKFSSDLLLSKKEEEMVIAKGDYSAGSIVNMAESLGTHPSVIVGRLQHRKLIEYWQDQSLMKKVEI